MTKEELEKQYNIKTGAECGNCGCKLTYGNDALTGFCTKCQEEENCKN